MGNVSINGKTADEGDLVGVFVGNELRSKNEVTIPAGTAWINVSVNAAGVMSWLILKYTIKF